ncbi:DUF2478 domain-containing protein [Bradyrhizobium nanningense]|uniref:DUF2478 domain-containing protein n=1 Tax=Bradyrhizobium nanningense TaxID=1325118 RepID=UPI0010093948
MLAIEVATGQDPDLPTTRQPSLEIGKFAEQRETAGWGLRAEFVTITRGVPVLTDVPKTCLAGWRASPRTLTRCCLAIVDFFSSSGSISQAAARGSCGYWSQRYRTT